MQGSLAISGDLPRMADVLIVDDEPGVLELPQHFAVDEGYSVATANNDRRRWPCSMTFGHRLFWPTT